MPDVLLEEVRGSELILTMNRPHVRNAIDAELGGRLVGALKRFEDDPGLRVAVLTGVGGFSSGMDLREFAQTVTPPWDRPENLFHLLRRRQTKPVIAAIEGFAIAGGLELAVWCDLIVASSDAQLGIPEVKHGLVAAGGGLRRLPAAISHQVSAEIALTGRSISAERAHQLGLVNQLATPGKALEIALELALEIAQHPAEAVAVTKNVLDHQGEWGDGEFWARQELLVDPLFRSPAGTARAARFVSARQQPGTPPPQTVPELIRARAAENSDKCFLTFGSQAFTYGDVDRLTDLVAASLRRLGVTQGSRVALMMSNQPEFLWLTWGLGKLGAVAVPLNVESRGPQLKYFLDQSLCSVLAIDADLIPRFAEIDDRPVLDTLIVTGSDSRSVEVDRVGSRIHVKELFEGDWEPIAITVSREDVSALHYTSGTTGPSKAAISPHGQPIAVAELFCEEFGYTSDDVLHTCLPLFHVNALWYSAVAALWCGGTLALGRRFSARRYWREVVDSGATVINLLGAMTNILEKLEPSPQERAHRVRYAMVAPSSRALYELLGTRYGIELITAFAATETFPVTLLRPADLGPDTAGSAGTVTRLAELQIVDTHGVPAPPGTPGEILVRPRRPHTMFQGYWDMPAETAAATSNFWFHTGDRGYVDDAGFLYFIDRIKEVIRRRGENISSYEVETIVASHPEVMAAAAVPLKSEMSEDEVAVFVVRRVGSTVTEQDIVNYCATRMAKYMVPRFIAWRSELPRTASQKVEKYKLRVDASEDPTAFWDREANSGVAS